MRKILIPVLLLIMALSLAACGGGNQPDSGIRHLDGGGNQVSESTAPSPTAAQASESSAPATIGDLAGDLSSMLRNYWPTDLVPNLPEYPYGNISGFAPPEYDGETIIRAADTSTDDLDEYLKTLEADGWTVTREGSASYSDYAEAIKGLDKVVFAVQGGNSVVFTATSSKIGQWPSFDEYPINCPPPEGFTLIDVDVEWYPDSPEEDSMRVGMFMFTCLDMSWDQEAEYFNLLKDGGYFEPFDWQGGRYVCITYPDYIQQEGDNDMGFFFDICLAD